MTHSIPATSKRPPFWFWLAFSLIAGCSSNAANPETSPELDASTPVITTPAHDAGGFELPQLVRKDAGHVDTVIDAGEPDASEAPIADAGEVVHQVDDASAADDAGELDAGTDAGEVDAAIADASTPDAGELDAGTDAGTTRACAASGVEASLCTNAHCARVCDWCGDPGCGTVCCDDPAYPGSNYRCTCD
jgi:hypothetical protein